MSPLKEKCTGFTVGYPPESTYTLLHSEIDELVIKKKKGLSVTLFSISIEKIAMDYLTLRKNTKVALLT